jgi:hypothetical protein
VAQFYDEITVAATYVLDGGHDFGFVPAGHRLALQAGGPVYYSFDGATDHGTLGPVGTRPMEVQSGGGKSRIWLRGAGAPDCSVWAWD